MRTTIGLIVTWMLISMVRQAAAQEPPTTWRFSLGVREANELSRDLNGVPEDDRTLDSANARLGLRTRTERSNLGLFGRVGANVVREGPGRDRLNYGGGLFWEYRPSTRLRSRLTQSVNRGFQLETLTELGVLQPDIDTFNSSTSWNLAYRAGPRTSLTTSVNYNYVNFETERPLDGSQIVLEDPPFDPIFEPLSEGASEDGDLEVPDAEDTVLQILASEGLAFRETTTHLARAGLGLSHRLTEYTTLGLDASGGYRLIDRTLGEAQDGAEAAARAYVQRTRGATSLDASYLFVRSLALEPNTTIQTARGGLTYSPTGRPFSVRLSGGVSYYQAEEVASQFAPVGEVAFSASLTRTTYLVASYRRQFQQSLGFGRTLLIDFANVSLTQAFGERVTLSAFAGTSMGTDPLDEGSNFDVYRLGGTLRVRILEVLTAGTTFTTLETERDRFGLDSRQTRELWTIFLTYSTTWH